MPQLFDRKTDAYFGTLHYAGYVLLAAGALVACSPWWWTGQENKAQWVSVGGLLVVLGILFKFTYHGFQLDFERRRVREYLVMFGMKFGHWAPLPSFERVVLDSNLVAEDHDHPGEAPVLVKWYTVGLYSSGNAEPGYELRTSHEAEALQALQLLSQQLHIPLENRLIS